MKITILQGSARPFWLRVQARMRIMQKVCSRLLSGCRIPTWRLMPVNFILVCAQPLKSWMNRSDTKLLNLQKRLLPDQPEMAVPR